MVGRRDRALLLAETDCRGRLASNAPAPRLVAIACPTLRATVESCGFVVGNLRVPTDPRNPHTESAGHNGMLPSWSAPA